MDLAPYYTYQVFLSFRGADTRRNFTDHLYAALTKAGIDTFRDDNNIQRGENIESEIDKAIQESKMSLVVLSKDYASSTWCLDELVMIMDRHRTAGHLVLPVFYDVDPSQVGEQTGSYGEAFARHQDCFQGEMERVEGWRATLKEVAYLGGMVLQDRHESQFIQDIVEEVGKKLDSIALTYIDIESEHDRYFKHNYGRDWKGVDELINSAGTKKNIEVGIKSMCSLMLTHVHDKEGSANQVEPNKSSVAEPQSDWNSEDGAVISIPDDEELEHSGSRFKFEPGKFGKSELNNSSAVPVLDTRGSETESKFIPTHPFFEVVLSPYRSASLRDRSWPVKLIIYFSRRKATLSAGWARYARENSLRMGDVCAFEMIKSADARGADQVRPNKSLLDKTESDGNRMDEAIPCGENIAREADVRGAHQVRPNQCLVDKSDSNSLDEARKSCSCDETIAEEADKRGAHQAKPNKSLVDKTESDGNGMDEAISCDETITGEADVRGAHQVRPNKSLVDKSDGNSLDKARKSCPFGETIAGEADMRGAHQAKPNKSLVDKPEPDGNRMDEAISCDENITGEADVRGGHQVRPKKSLVDKSDGNSLDEAQKYCPFGETIAGEADMRGAYQAKPNKSLVDKTESDGNSPDEARKSRPFGETIAGEADMSGAHQAKPNKSLVDKTEFDGNRMDEAISCDENITLEADVRGGHQVRPKQSLVDKSDGNSLDKDRKSCPCDETIAEEADKRGAHQAKPNKSLVDKTESDGNGMDEAISCDETITGEADVRGALQVRPNKSLVDKSDGALQVRPNKSVVDKSDGNSLDDARKARPFGETIAGEADMRGAHQAKPNKSLVDKTESDGNRMDEAISCDANITGEADVRGGYQVRPNKSLVDKSDGNSLDEARKSRSFGETIAGEADMRGARQAKPNKSLVDKIEPDGYRMDEATISIPCDETITGEAGIRGANQVLLDKSLVDKSDGNSPNEVQKSCPRDETIAGEADMRRDHQVIPNKSLVDKTESDGNSIFEARICSPCDENIIGEADIRGAIQVLLDKSLVDNSDGNSPNEARKSCPCDQTIAGEADMRGDHDAGPNTIQEGPAIQETRRTRRNIQRPAKLSDFGAASDHQVKPNKRLVNKTESDGNSIVEARISSPCDETIAAEADAIEANQVRPNKSLVDKTESDGNGMDEARISSPYDEDITVQPQLSESEFKTEAVKC
ncbi:unnamed protein product [Dovyalis caffra]|uniref:TIR domain-containing protein n=1 Tax=Dovyalis caffra TaxID=77055 RepID=A0AAV1SWV2_9ROSI|nr:unnamed protein product [Dovyalis caffra]